MIFNYWKILSVFLGSPPGWKKLLYIRATTVKISGEERSVWACLTIEIEDNNKKDSIAWQSEDALVHKTNKNIGQKTEVLTVGEQREVLDKRDSQTCRCVCVCVSLPQWRSSWGVYSWHHSRCLEVYVGLAGTHVPSGISAQFKNHNNSLLFTLSGPNFLELLKQKWAGYQLQVVHVIR